MAAAHTQEPGGRPALHTRLMTLSARLIHLAGAPWSSRRNENTPERRPRRSPRICGVSEPSWAPTRSAGPAAWLGARGSGLIFPVTLNKSFFSQAFVFSLFPCCVVMSRVLLS